MQHSSRIIAIVSIVMMVIGGVAQAESLTVATFADPSAKTSDPLFTVVWPNGNSTGTVNGGWADGKGGLTLEIPLIGNSYTNAWFEMDELTIISTASIFGQTFGQTGAGQIRFYEQGSSSNPLLVLDFDTAMVSQIAMGSNDFFANVTITGSVIPYALSDEVFSFGFANVMPLNGNINTKGFTATAAFTSSAVPEPATVALLGLGTLTLFGKRFGK